MRQPSVSSKRSQPASEILTFLIADVRGYTAFTQAHGDEAAGHLAATFAEIAREGVEARGGSVIELRGDEALAVFTSARQALRAAVDLQQTFVDEVQRDPTMPLRVGIGLDAGEAVPVEDGYRGGALNLAARLCGRAGPGEVLVSQGVLLLARAVEGIAFHDTGPHALKGLEEPVQIFQATIAGQDPGETLRLLDDAVGSDRRRRPAPLPIELDHATPLVGRDTEARTLRWWWRQARRGPARVVAVHGPPGSGRTRLAAEVAQLAAADGALITYGTGDDAELLERPAPSSDHTQLTILEIAAPIDEHALDAVRSWSSRPAGMAVLIADPDDEGGRRIRQVVDDEDVVRLGPLDLPAVEAIASLYLPGGSEGAPTQAILEASDGLPARIHALASDWAKTEASKRLGSAAALAAERREGLRSIETTLAENVVDLQLVRERAELFIEGVAQATIDGTRTPPYRALATFDVTDAPLFFGRERLVADMVGRLAGSTLLGVVGPSGSGKSSAVRAGLLAALMSDALPDSAAWAQAVVRPGAYPLRALDRAVWAALPDHVRGSLEGAELPLRLARDAMGPSDALVLLVDQFEELFTLCGDEAERQAFVSALVEAADDPRSNVLVIVAVRADYYGRCATYPRLAELIGSSHVLVGPMTADEYARAIVGPARRTGLVVEPALVDALVGEVVDEPGALPLLSTTLFELWQHRDGRTLRMEAYERTGGVHGAVARIAEETFAKFSEHERSVVRAVMLRLTGTGDGTEVVRRRVPLEELDLDRNEDVAHVVRALTDDRLLTVADGSLEVSHEALLREWPRFQTWLEEDRSGRRLRTHLTEQARNWADAGREPGELYRGARLASALDWTTEHTLELNELEREFLAQSRQASEAEVAQQRTTNRRLRVLLAGVAIFLALALLAGGLALSQRSKAQAAAEAAEARRLGAQAVSEDELDLSLLLAAQSRTIEDSIDTRSTLLDSLLNAIGAIGVLPGTGDRVLTIRSSADGRTFIAMDHIGGIAVYDAETLRLRRIVRLPDQAALSLHPDGRSLVGQIFDPATQRPSLVFVDLTTGEVRLEPLAEGDFLCCDSIAHTPDGRSFLTLEDRGAGPLWVRYDLTGQQLEAEPADVSADGGNLTYSPDGRHLIFESNGLVTFFDAGTRMREFEIEASFAFDVAPDGATVAYGTEDGRLFLVDVASGRRREGFGRHNAAVTGVGYPPDGRTIVTTGDDRDVIVWDAPSGQLREILHGHAGRAFGPVFDPTGDTAFTVGLDGKVIAWDLSGRRRLSQRSTWVDPSLLDLGLDLKTAVSPDGSTIAVRDAGNEVIVTDVGSADIRWRQDPWSTEHFEQLVGEQHPSIRPFLSEGITELAFSPDGATLAVSGEHQEVVLYDAADGTERQRWSASRAGWVNHLSFTPDGDLVTASDDGSVTIWDATTTRAIQTFQVTPFAPDAESYDGAVASAFVSPDGKRLAVTTFTQGGPYALGLIDLESGDEMWTGRRTDLWYSIMAWSPDSSTIATGGWQSGELLLWDAATGKRLGEPVRASAGFVISLDFAWDGALVVTGATDGTVRLFETATRKQVGSNLPGVDNMWTAGFVLPEDRLLALTQTGTAFSWDLDPDRWSAQACRIANRRLTRSEWRTFLPGRPYEPAC